MTRQRVRAVTDEETREGWEPDAELGAPFLAKTLPLPPDEEGEVVATLVRLPSPRATTTAVLYVHGYSDYFFQRDLASWFAERGHDFYAVDLRKYGRSLRTHQTPGYVADIREHFPDLDAAWDEILRHGGYERVLLVGHSTGGLILPLWADARQPAALAGLVLNSPWLDMQGGFGVRVLATPGVHALGRYRPKAVMAKDQLGVYGKALHVDAEGEWRYNTSLKPFTGFAVYAGWLSAIRRAHTRLHRGLDVPAPVLVLHSARSGRPVLMSEEVHTTDIVLEVEQIRRWAVVLGRHVTAVAVEGAMHDVFLSRKHARDTAYAEMGTWLDAYLT